MEAVILDLGKFLILGVLLLGVAWMLIAFAIFIILIFWGER